MAEFLAEDDLNRAIEDIIYDAEEVLFIVSPFIRLHKRIKNAIASKAGEHKLEVMLLYGKNERDTTKSLNEEDSKFLKTLPNIRIRYNPNLHAKFYMNEHTAILSSMNLYEFSHDNNIEFGVRTTTSKSIIGGIAKSIVSSDFDFQAADYFQEVFEQSEEVFDRAPEYKKSWFGLRSKYQGSTVQHDTLTENYKDKSGISRKRLKTIDDFQDSYGYCIRTGKRIPFNMKRPFSAEAYKAWSKFGNETFPEKYCHYSGERSDGSTSFKFPVLKKYFNDAVRKTNQQ